jgi:hypothetical protein
MGRVSRILLACAVLAFWAGPASAFCVAEAAYEYVMREEGPAPSQSLPCCTSARAPASAPKDSSAAGCGGSLERGFIAAAIGGGASRLALGSPLRWRSYCERSSRLLR